jgi:hypothetical protein
VPLKIKLNSIRVDKTSLTTWARKFFEAPGSRMLIVVSILAGTAAGLCAFLFEELISHVRDFSFGRISQFTQSGSLPLAAESMTVSFGLEKVSESKVSSVPKD